MRNIDPDVETLSYLYAISSSGRLVGVVPIWRMRFSADAPHQRHHGAGCHLRQRLHRPEEVARVVSQYGFFAIRWWIRTPVAGIITHDDVIDILQEEFTEDVQRFGGSVPLGTPPEHVDPRHGAEAGRLAAAAVLTATSLAR